MQRSGVRITGALLCWALAGLLPCVAQQMRLADAPAAAAEAAPGSAAVAARADLPRLQLPDWSGLAAAATLRILDFTSTEAALEHPRYLHEAILPDALVQNQAAFAAFEAGTVVLNYGAYRVLVRHRLGSLARISQFVYVGVLAGQVAVNYQNLSRIPSR